MMFGICFHKWVYFPTRTEETFLGELVSEYDITGRDALRFCKKCGRLQEWVSGEGWEDLSIGKARVFVRGVFRVAMRSPDLYRIRCIIDKEAFDIEAIMRNILNGGVQT